MNFVFSTHKERTSTFVMVLPDEETLKKIKTYSVVNKIPNPCGFPPYMMVHSTLLRNGHRLEFPRPDAYNYHKPIVVNTKNLQPRINLPPHKQYATVTLAFHSPELLKRREIYAQEAGVVADPGALHITLSYYTPPEFNAILPPLGFDLVFDRERIDDYSAYPRPPEVQRRAVSLRNHLSQVRLADMKGIRVSQFRRF